MSSDDTRVGDLLRSLCDFGLVPVVFLKEKEISMKYGRSLQELAIELDRQAKVQKGLRCHSGCYADDRRQREL